jgi:Zn-dependent protease
VDLLIRMPVVLLALTVHEFSHAYVAWRMGDPTAYRLGRCTLNPLKHLDPLGTLCLVFAPIGWAKPVPVNPINFDDRRKGNLYTTGAGPASNLAQAFVFALLMRAFVHGGHWIPEMSENAFIAIWEMLYLGVFINVGLTVFNLLPFYPLDGYHVSMELLPPDGQRQMADLAPVGPYLIVALVMISRLGGLNLIGRLIEPPANLLFEYVAGLEPGFF